MGQLKIKSWLLISVPLLLISCFESHIRYELKDKAKVNQEIFDVVGHVSKTGKELGLDLVRCDSYGVNKCSGITIVEGTLEAIAFFEETKDTLQLSEIKEGTRFYKCKNFRQAWRNNDKLGVYLTYKVDSLNVIYDKDLFLLLHKDESYHFTVH
jgi:hypothetical protein